MASSSALSPSMNSLGWRPDAKRCIHGLRVRCTSFNVMATPLRFVDPCFQLHVLVAMTRAGAAAASDIVLASTAFSRCYRCPGFQSFEAKIRQEDSDYTKPRKISAVTRNYSFVATSTVISRAFPSSQRRDFCRPGCSSFVSGPFSTTFYQE